SADRNREEADHGKGSVDVRTREDLPAPVVREGGGGGGEVLCLGLPRFAGEPGLGAAQRITERAGGLGEGRGLHGARAAIPGDERRSPPRLQRRDLAGRVVRRPGGAGSL